MERGLAQLRPFPLWPHPGARGGGESQNQWRALPELSDSRPALLSKSFSIPSRLSRAEQLTLSSGFPTAREPYADAPGTKLFPGKRSPETLSARLAKSSSAIPRSASAVDGGVAAIQRQTIPYKIRAGYRCGSRAIRKDTRTRFRPCGPRHAEIAQARLPLRTASIPTRPFPATVLRQGRRLEQMALPSAPLPIIRAVGPATGGFPSTDARWQNAQAKVNPVPCSILSVT